MKNVALLAFVESMMWKSMEMNRRTQGRVNFYSYFFLIYAYRHQIPLEFDTYKGEKVLEHVLPTDDDLFNNLYVVASKEGDSLAYDFQDVAWYYEQLCNIIPSHFNEIYPELVESLIRKMAMSANRLDAVQIQPKEITDVVCHILKKHQVQDIYNPYSGLASYAVGMKGAEHYNSYYGREINERTALLSRLRIDAYDMNDTAIVECANVLEYWRVDYRKFDAVVATPPFGIKVYQSSSIVNKSRTVEDTVFWDTLQDTEGCKTAVIVVPTSFLHRRDSVSFNLRKTLCEKKILEMVINLPENIFYGTSIATTIMVLNFASTPDSITFIDAQNAVVGKGKDRQLDANAVVAMIEGQHIETTTVVPFSETFHHDCILIPTLYESAHVPLSEGERLCRMKDLMEETRGERVSGLEQCNILNESDFSSDFFEVISKEDVISLTDAPMSLRKIHGPHLVLSTNGAKLTLYMHKGDTDFYIRGHHLAIKPNPDFVCPEYLAYLLLKSKWSKMLTNFMIGTHLKRVSMLQFGNMKMGILDLNGQQHAFIEDLKDKHKQELAQIHKAELERMGFRDVYSDVIHMLGTPFHKQAQVVKLLKKTSKDDEKYVQRVKALMDISMYIQRVIDLVGKDFSNAELDLDKVDLGEFLSEYHLAWNNYASGIYRMQTELDIDGNPMVVDADKDLLMILMDTVTDNAKRHGFGSSYHPENIVNISLQHVKYGEKPCVLLSVSNNGYPMDEGFTIQDYITRGSFKGEHGRTGLGGNHIHTIVKKHGGWLNIRNDKSWSFIVDMLFPMVDPSDEDFNDYDYEAI